MRSQAITEETSRSKCWSRALLKASVLLYNEPQLQNNSWPISEQAVSPVQSWQPTEGAEHTLFEKGRPHTEPHPSVLTRIRPYRAKRRWVLRELTIPLRQACEHADLPWSEGGFWSEGDGRFFPETLPDVASCNKIIIRNKSVPTSFI